jgi:hypothetical protein
MNNGNIELNELCSRKLLDMYKTTQTPTVKLAIEAELMKREHFTHVIDGTNQQH